jgi:hypothetical protein
MTEVRKKTIAVALEGKTRKLLAFLVVALAISYIYFANSAVRNLTQLQKTGSELANLNIEVSDLESVLISMQSKIDMQTAKRLGLSEYTHPTFIVRAQKSQRQSPLSIQIR